MTKKKHQHQPSELERAIWGAAMLQPPTCYDGVEIDCWGVKLVNVTRNPGVLRQLIDDGRFGSTLGDALRLLIVRPSLANQPIDDHEIRLIHSDGFGYALYSIARHGKCKLAVLAFARGPVPFSEADKAKMFKALAMAESLVRKLLEEQIQIAKEEAR